MYFSKQRLSAEKACSDAITGREKSEEKVLKIDFSRMKLRQP